MNDLDSRPLNILMIGGAIPWYPPVGGSAVVPLHLAEALGKAGHHVDYLVVSLDGSRMESGYLRPIHMPMQAHTRTYRSSLYRPLYQYLKVKDRLSSYDIVYCESHRAPFYALHRAISGGTPKLATAIYVSGIPRFFWQRRSPVELYNYIALRLADLVVCPSDYSRNNVSQAYGVALSKTRALHGGVASSFPAQTFSAKKGGKFTLLFCGRLNGKEPVKMVDLLLEAVSHIIRKHSVELNVIGAGSRLDEYAALARDFGIEDEVHFLGHVDHDKLPSHYASADLVVLPSRMENFPLVILEAMATGLPVVATSVGGVPEMVVEGETGLLVAPYDPGALAEAINSLLGDPSRMRAMGARGRERVREQYTWEKVAERVARYFREVV